MSASKHQHQTLVKHLVDIAKTEGVPALFKGWTPAFLRLGPHTIVTFLVLEEMKRWHSSFIGSTPPSSSAPLTTS